MVNYILLSFKTFRSTI